MASSPTGGPGRTPAPPRPVSDAASLAGSESVVACSVADGLSNQDIALRLVLSRRTVEIHASHVLAKLGATSRTELVLAAARS